MKKTVSILLIICVTAGILASCAQTDTSLQTTEDPQSSVAKETEQTTFETTTAEETTVEETTEEATTAAPLVMTPAVPFNPADRLEPTQEDFERLEGLLFWSRFDYKDYDSDHDRILDYISNAGTITAGMEVYDLLRENDNYAYNDAMDADRMHVGSDPRGYYSSNGVYMFKKIRADVMEYYLENVFHNFSYPEQREGNVNYTDNEGNEYTYWMYYYEDGWYYFNFEAIDDDSVLLVREHKTKSNGHYLLTIDRASFFDHDAIGSTFQVDATLTQKDGRRLWTIYSTKVLYNRFLEERDQ